MVALKVRRGALRLALLFLTVAAGALAGQPPPPPPVSVEEFNDAVQLKNNNPIGDVRVVSDNWDGVTVRGKGQVTIARTADEILSVEYATTRPPEYEQAWEMRRSGKIKEAIDLFERGLRKLGKDADKPQRQYFQAGLADCFDANNDLDRLGKIVDEMVNQKPEPPRLVFEVSLKLGASCFRMREGARAEEAFKRMVDLCKKLEDKAPPDKRELKNYIEHYRFVADLGRIRSLEAQGKIDGIDGAERAYQIYPARAGGYPDLVAQAKIGEMRCRAVKDPEGAIKELMAQAAKLPEATLPAAYCAVGDAYMAKAESAKKDELDYYWARWYYLKVVVQCPTDRASLARAYYGAGRCCELLGEKVREPRAADKAARYFEIVDREFRDTPEYSLVKGRASQ